MKYYFLLFFLWLACTDVYSQDEKFPFLHGLRDKSDNVYLEVSGYEIAITTIKGDMAEAKTIKSAKKKYGLETVLAEFSDPQLSVENRIIEAESPINDRPNIKANVACYLLRQSDRQTTIILFQTAIPRDKVLEHEIVQCYLENGLYNYITDELTPSSFSFAGREVSTRGVFHWKEPHNIQYGNGQISWSEFSSAERAQLHLQTCMKANFNEKIIILMEEEINVVFEDIPTTAHRVVYKNINTKEYPLIVYYIAHELRGRFVSCTLSNYGYDRFDYDLATLLRKVMFIPEIPKHDYSDEEYEEMAVEETKIDVDFIKPFEIQAGVKLPIGNLRNAYKISSLIGMSMGYTFNRSMAVDLGIQLGFASNRKPYDFYYDDQKYSTKTVDFAGLYARYRYQKVVASNLYFTTYAGLGLNCMYTDLEKENPKDDQDKYHTIETVDLFAGVNLRYKLLGLFLEYHYTPYSISDKVRNNFGNSAINIGLSAFF